MSELEVIANGVLIFSCAALMRGAALLSERMKRRRHAAANPTANK